MSKKELFKKYQEILLKTNGGVDDYVVALCQISNLIKDYAEEKDQQICDLEAKLKALQNGIIDDKTLNMLVKEHKLYKDLETKLAESESKRKSLEEKIKFLTEETEENFVDGQKYNQLKHQLEKSEKLKESYRLQNEQHHLQLLQFYSRLGVEAFGADIHEKALETLMIMKEQLAEKDKEIEELKLKLDIRAISLQNFNIERMQANQDKISFAIEQLEKVLVLIQNAVNIDSPEYDLVGLYDAVSNQIKQLKEKE